MKKKSILLVLICILIIIGIIVIINNKPTKKEKNNTKESNKIYSEEIKSIKIKYYLGYNIATGDAISDTIPLNTINLESKDLEEISKIIREITKIEISENDEMYNHYKYDYICDYYKIEINDKTNIYIGNEYGMTEGKEYFKVPKELYDKVLEITKRNNENRIYKKIDSKKITIISNNEKLELSEENLKEISKYSYYVINAKDEEFKEEKVVYTLDLNDGRKIDIYYASVLSCMHYKDGTHEYIYTGDLEKFIEKIFENSKVKIDIDNATKIKVMYKKKEYIIDNKEKINEIIKKLKDLEYRDYNYLSSMKESNFNENDIKIYINKVEYIIPGDRGYASRFFVDSTGKMYDISALGDLEKYFKEIVDYK